MAKKKPYPPMRVEALPVLGLLDSMIEEHSIWADDLQNFRDMLDDALTNIPQELHEKHLAGLRHLIIRSRY